MRSRGRACRTFIRTASGIRWSVLEMPETMKEIDARFDARIERIMEILDDEEAIGKLLKMPTKGLPN